MEDSTDKSMQISKCCMIYELLSCNAYLFDAADKDLFNISDNTNYPKFFKELIDNEILLFLQHIKQSKATSAHYYNSPYCLCFIGMALGETDAPACNVVVGPFLEEGFSFSGFASRYSSLLQKMGSSESIMSFYKTLKVFSFAKSDKLLALVYNIFSHTLKFPDTEYVTNIKQKTPISDNRYTDENDSSYWKMYNELEKTLIHSISELDIKKTKDILNRMKLNYSSQSGIHSLQRIKDLLTMINSTLARAAINSKVPLMISYTLSAKLAHDIEKVSNMSGYSNLIVKLFEEYFELILQYTQKKYSLLINEAINIIDDNSQNPISLIDISSKLHISPEHLSRKFKTETKMTITEYIHKAKIDTAITLMEQKQMTLLEISQSLGYINYSHFHKWFKKLTGVSPKNYTA